MKNFSPQYVFNICESNEVTLRICGGIRYCCRILNIFFYTCSINLDNDSRKVCFLNLVVVHCSRCLSRNSSFFNDPNSTIIFCVWRESMIHFGWKWGNCWKLCTNTLDNDKIIYLSIESAKIKNKDLVCEYTEFPSHYCILIKWMRAALTACKIAAYTNLRNDLFKKKVRFVKKILSEA